MKEYGIRQAKAHLSKIVREAAVGASSIVTDNKKPVAMIGPPPKNPDEPELLPAKEPKPPGDASAFHKALFSAPYPLELDF